MMSVNVSWSKN